MDMLSVIYIIIAGILWGTAGIFVNNLTPYGFEAIQMTSMRNIVAVIAMFTYVLIKMPTKLKIKLKDVIMFFISGVLIFAASAFYYTTMKLTTQATAVVIMYSAPILSTIISVLFMGEKLTVKKSVAIIMIFISCGLITGIIGGIKLNALGIITGVLSAVSYGLYTVLAKIEMNRKNDPVIANAYAFLAAAILGVLLGKPCDIVSKISVNPIAILPFAIGIGVFTGAIPYFLYTLASKKLPAGVASALSSIEPLTAALISFTIYGEQVTFQSLAGIITMIFAIILLNRCE